MMDNLASQLEGLTDRLSYKLDKKLKSNISDHSREILKGLHKSLKGVKIAKEHLGNISTRSSQNMKNRGDNQMVDGRLDQDLLQDLNVLYQKILAGQSRNDVLMEYMRMTNQANQGPYPSPMKQPDTLNMGQQYYPCYPGPYAPSPIHTTPSSSPYPNTAWSGNFRYPNEWNSEYRNGPRPESNVQSLNHPMMNTMAPNGSSPNMYGDQRRNGPYAYDKPYMTANSIQPQPNYTSMPIYQPNQQYAFNRTFQGHICNSNAPYDRTLFNGTNAYLQRQGNDIKPAQYLCPNVFTEIPTSGPQFYCQTLSGPDSTIVKSVMPYPEATIRPVIQSAVYPSPMAPTNSTFIAPSNPISMTSNNPSFMTPSSPNFMAPSNPNFMTPSNTSFMTPSNPSFMAPSNPNFIVPSNVNLIPPSTPSFVASNVSNFSSNYNPSFIANNNPSFMAPNNDTYESDEQGFLTTSGSMNNSASEIMKTYQAPCADQTQSYNSRMYGTSYMTAMDLNKVHCPDLISKSMTPSLNDLTDSLKECTIDSSASNYVFPAHSSCSHHMNTPSVSHVNFGTNPEGLYHLQHEAGSQSNYKVHDQYNQQHQSQQMMPNFNYNRVLSESTFNRPNQGRYHSCQSSTFF